MIGLSALLVMGSAVAVGVSLSSGASTTKPPSLRPIGRTASFHALTGTADSDVGCTWLGSCVAIGGFWTPPASNGAIIPPPYGVGMWSVGGGRWHDFHTLPAAISSTDLYLSSCLKTSCLLVGQGISGDAVWRYAGATHHLTVLHGPRGGSAILAVSCWGAKDCLVADVAGPERIRDSIVLGLPVRFFETWDFGDTWHLNQELTDLRMRSVQPQDDPASDYGVDSISCTDFGDCVIGYSGATTVRLNARGSNAGVSSSWLISLHGDQVLKTFLRNQLINAVQCYPNGTCEALATGRFPFETLAPVDVWLTFDRARHWGSFPDLLPTHDTYVFEAQGSQELACPRLGECMMVDQRGGVYESSGKRWTLREPQGWGYQRVSCGHHWCVAGSDTGPSLFALR
jgi:hypothetical protein